MAGNARWGLAAAGSFVVVGLALLLWLRDVPVPAAGKEGTQAGARPPAAAASPRNAKPLAAPSFAGVPHTELPLRLLATVVREDRSRSLAAVEDEEHGGSQILTEGRPFANYPKAELAHIGRSRILIDNEGVREQLVFDHSTASASAPDAAANEPSADEIDRRRELSDRLRDLMAAGEDYQDAGAEPWGGLLGEGDVQPVYEDGEMIGIEIDAIRAGGLYDQLGLRNGDLVTSVNGVSLAGPTAVAQLLAEFALSDEWTFTVDRGDGSEDTLSIPIDELAAKFEALE